MHSSLSTRHYHPRSPNTFTITSETFHHELIQYPSFISFSCNCILLSHHNFSPSFFISAREYYVSYVCIFILSNKRHAHLSDDKGQSVALLWFSRSGRVYLSTFMVGTRNICRNMICVCVSSYSSDNFIFN